MTTESLIQERELFKLGAAYLALLEMPVSSNFRSANQDIYARLRDAIAERFGVEPERIQDEFERKASR